MTCRFNNGRTVWQVKSCFSEFDSGAFCRPCNDSNFSYSDFPSQSVTHNILHLQLHKGCQTVFSMHH